MENVLFLQSAMKDPYRFYTRMRGEHPVYFDNHNKIWAVYTHLHCEQILQATDAHIPVPGSQVNKQPELNGILSSLARLSNGALHPETRAAAIQLMSHWKHVDVTSLFQSLMGEPRHPTTIDWVSDIAKRLPAFTLMKGFDFPTHTALSLLQEIETLMKLMAPVDNEKDVWVILKSVREVQKAFTGHLLKKLPVLQDTSLYFANFIGLLIQSYDATRGLLSNALFHYVNYTELRPSTLEGFKMFVRESARFDPTVQNTRRTMVRDMLVGNHIIKHDEQVLVVLGSANRDFMKFPHADSFMPDRINKALSFGSGVHRCIAEEFSIQLAATVLYYLDMKYSKFEIQETEIQYEDRINVRLPRKITLVTS